MSAHAVSVNEQGYRSFPNQTANQITAPARKWFSLQQNRLDGTHHPMPAEGSEQIGWWGSSLSGAGGAFSAPYPELTATFPAEDMSSVQVAGDSLLGEYPVDFEIRLYNGANVLLKSEIVTGNTQVVAPCRFGSAALGVTRLSLTITRWSAAGRTVKINEAYNAFQVLRTDTVRPRVADQVHNLGIGVIRGDMIRPKTTESRLVTVRTVRTDAVRPKVTDTRAVTAQVTRPDTLVAAVSEARTLTARMARPDTLRAMMLESRALTNTLLTRTDVVAPAAVETRIVTVAVARSDNVALIIAEARAVAVQTVRSDLTQLAAFESRAVSNRLPVRFDTLWPSLSDRPAVSVQTRRPDTLAAVVSEVRTITTQLTRPDLLRPKIVDVQSVTNLLPTRADIIAPAVTEARVVTVWAVRADGAALAATEATTITTQMTRTDLWPLMAAETRLITARLARPDTLSPRATEGRTLTNVLPARPDLITAAVVETRAVTVSASRADSLAPKVGEALSLTVATMRADPLWVFVAEGRMLAILAVRNDQLAPKLAERTAVTNTLPVRTDALRPRAEEARSLTNRLPMRTDSICVQVLGGAATFILVTSDDRAVIVVVTDQNLHNIHSVMNADERRIYGRVEITYTDPFLDESISVTASGTAYPTVPEQVANNIETSQRKWFSLQRNTLDGTYHPMATDGRESIGWWSNVLADATGVFAAPPTLSIAFAARPISRLKVVGDDKLEDWPVDFEIRLYGAGGALLHTEAMVGNQARTWTKTIDPVLNVTRMELTVQRVNRGRASAKVIEFYTAVQETYDVESVQLLRLLEEMQYESATLPIGNVSANELTVRLDNTDRRFDPANPFSPLRNLIKRNRRVRAWLGSEVVAGEIEWHPIGVFWTQDWRTPETEVWAETRAWDRLEFLRASEFSTSQVYVGHSLYQLAELVLQDAGLVADEYHIDPALQTIIVPYAWFPRTTHRKALLLIAGAALGQVYCDRSGKIVVEVFQPVNSPMFTFTRDNIMDKDHPLAWEGIVNHVEVQATTYRPTTPETIVDDSEEVIVPPAGVVERLYTFTSVPVMDVQAPVITAGANTSVREWAAYAWGMRVVFENTGAEPEAVTQVVATGVPLKANGKVAVAQDAQSIRDLGKQAMSEVIANPLIQTTAQAQAIANSLLAANKDPRRDIVLDARGNIALRLGDRIKAPVYRDIVVEEFYITRQSLEWDGALRARVEARKIGGD